jgi:chemotaxis signal transduction protein
MTTTPTLNGRLLLAQAGPHLLAFPVEEVIALLPTTRRAIRGWIAGNAQYRRQDIAVVSLHDKFQFTRADAPTRGVVVLFAETWIAIEVDPNTRIADQAERRIHPFRDSLSSLPSGAIHGVVRVGDETAFLLNIESLFTLDDAVQMGEALFG